MRKQNVTNGLEYIFHFIAVVVCMNFVILFSPSCESKSGLYVVTESCYVPNNDEVADVYIKAIAKNKNDAMSSLQVMYDNPQGFTHLFEGDTVEFLEETFYGIKIRKTSGMRELAIIPSMRILKKVNK